QFANDRLDAAAAHADTSADRIDAAIARNDRDLGAATRISGDRTDLDDAVVDFRHLLREQFRHELRVRARQKNLWTARFLAHVINVGAYGLAVPEAFARQQFIPPQHGFGASKIDHDVAEFDAFDQTVDDFADAVLEFAILPLPFGIAHFLHDDLLGGL